MAMVVGLSCELVKRGHQVDVVCIDRPSGSPHEAQWIDHLAGCGIPVLFLGRRPGSPGMLAALKLWWLIQRKAYDIVHSHLPMPDAISGLARCLSIRRFAHVVTVHNSWEPRSTLLTLFATHAHVAYCSEVVRKRNPLAGSSATVIPNGIEQANFARPSLSKQQIRLNLGIPAEATVVIAVGRMCPQKDFDTALEALLIHELHKMNSGLQCLFCGDGEDRIRLEVRAHRMGLDDRARFIGARTDIPELLKASDIFLSTSRYEGLPLTVLEALSAGLTCVLSDIEEHREIAATAHGCYFVPNVPEAIAIALEDAAIDIADSQLLRDRRASLLQRYTIAHCADSYDAFYRASSPSASPFPHTPCERGANAAS